MRRSYERGRFRPVALAMMLLGLLAVQTGTVADSLGNAGAPLGAAAGEPNDLRWDLAKGFTFEWKSAELSAKISKGDDVNAPVRILTVSAKLDILDMVGLVIVDMNSVGIYEVLDQDGNATPCQAAESELGRRYDHRNWHWGAGGTWLGMPLKPFSVGVRLLSDPSHRALSSISQLTGYIYAIYADAVVNVDIPFDPDYGWHDAKAVPSLELRVDLLTPPCPGPLQYVTFRGVGDPRIVNLDRPATPIPLYKYTTWVKAKDGGPMLGLFDPWYLRKSNPLGNYAIVRTELFDSKRKTAYQVRIQDVTGDRSGTRGASCYGEKAQASGDTYDSIRHVIAVHPVEVKIPFVLKNIPLPALQPTAK